MGRRRRRLGATNVSFFAFQDVMTSVVGIFVLITVIMVLELAQTVAMSHASHPSVDATELLAVFELLNAEISELQQEYDELQSVAVGSAGVNRFNREEETQRLSAEIQRVTDRISRNEAARRAVEEQLAKSRGENQRLLEESAAAYKERQRLTDLENERRDVGRFAVVLELDRPRIFRDTTEGNRGLVLVQLINGEIQVSDGLNGSTRNFSGSSKVNQFARWLEGTDLSARHFLVILKPSGASLFEDLQSKLKAANAVFGYDVAGEDDNYALHFQFGSSQ